MINRVENLMLSVLTMHICKLKEKLTKQPCNVHSRSIIYTLQKQFSWLIGKISLSNKLISNIDVFGERKA
jgi:hypothetical protein